MLAVALYEPALMKSTVKQIAVRASFRGCKPEVSMIINPFNGGFSARGVSTTCDAERITGKRHA